MTTLQKAQRPVYHPYQHIMVMSGYGFVIVLASFLSLYLGVKVDQYFGTAPNFMFGMFFLALFLAIGRLYHEAWQRRKEF